MLQIDLYTDISCPWCIIGQHRLDKVIEDQYHVRGRHKPVGRALAAVAELRCGYDADGPARGRQRVAHGRSEGRCGVSEADDYKLSLQGLG